jgi:type II secretory pathway component PulC
VGWTNPKVRRVIAHYEGQNEDDAVKEDEESFKGVKPTVMQVPSDLVPAVRSLLARHRRHAAPASR